MSSGSKGPRNGDFAFLSFLLRGPRSAYDIKKAMAASVSHFWTAAHSQVYQQAKRLVRDGYVEEQEVGGGRRKRLLSLTPPGRKVVLAWLAEPADLPGFYSDAMVKIFFADDLNDPEATLAMIEDLREQVAARLASYRQMRKDLKPREGVDYRLMTLEHGIAITKAALEWHEKVIAELRRAHARG